MFPSWKIGRAFGIPLYVHSTFLLVPVLVAFALRQRGVLNIGLATYLSWLALVLAVFGCVLLHELGHALMALRFGIRTTDITLYPIGGVARLQRLSTKAGEEMLIALAGPAVNVAIILLLAPLAYVLGTWAALAPASRHAMVLLAKFLTLMVYANMGLALFNMLPVFPMDGGRVLRAFLTWFLGSLRATVIAANIGLVFAVGFGIVGVLLPQPMLVVVALFVVMAGRQELAAVRHREAVRAARAKQAEAQKTDNHPFVEPRRNPILDDDDDEEIETIALPSHLDGSPARPEGSAVRAGRGGFTGLIWDRDAQTWVRWDDGRPVAVYDGTS
jgi:Zn-dependent protease